MRTLNDEYSQDHLKNYHEILDTMSSLSGLLVKYHSLIYEYDKAGDRIDNLKDEILNLKSSLGQ